MLIRVIRSSEEIELVRVCDLDELIQKGHIIAFLRSEGWAFIGSDPIRTRQIPFPGPGRRWTDITFPAEEEKVRPRL